MMAYVFIAENNRSDTVRDKMNLVAARSRNSEVLNRILLRNLDLTQTVFTRSVEHVNHNKNNFKFIRSIVFY